MTGFLNKDKREEETNSSSLGSIQEVGLIIKDND